MNTAVESFDAGVLRNRLGLETQLAPTAPLNTDAMLEELRSAIANCLNAREAKVAIDLSAVKYVNSEGIEDLLSFQDQLTKAGGRLKLLNAGPVLLDVFRVTGLDQHISVVGTDDEDPQGPNFIARTKPTLGEMLLAQGLVTEGQVQQALKLQESSGKRLGEIIVEQDWVPEQDVLKALGTQLAVPFVRLRTGLFDPVVAELIDKELAQRLRVLPMFRVRGAIYLATTQPQDIPMLTEVKEQLGVLVKPVLARREDILKTIEEFIDGDDVEMDLLDDVLEADLELIEGINIEDEAAVDEMASGSPVINLVNSLIQRAVRDGASDVHIEPSRAKSRVRFRIDGVLYEVMTRRMEVHAALVSRLKVMANLDISERRLPQDGRIQVFTQGRSVDLRFSSLPGLFGEKVVLRILDKNNAILDIDKLGMAQANKDSYQRLLQQGYGLILVTGPTGSGKTTSLYAALNYLNSIEKNIVTIEDPVEYQVDIINQNEVREKIGLTFAKVLKHVLRQDPDIVMVGEIRERETAEIAVQAALTGHLVLSTLHTNDSTGAITRMIDMGVEPYLLSSALIGVVAQRLIRTICPSCKTTFLAPSEIAERYGWEEGTANLAKGRGCTECYDSGYRGRMGIHEVLETGGDLQRLIISNPSRDQLNEFIEKEGNKTLFEDGLARALEQKTTIEEVARVINV
ncbi:MAG: ATPase, T2SS/T4P/T4SS family [Gammaproteobacteria bacterium]